MKGVAFCRTGDYYTNASLRGDERTLEFPALEPEGTLPARYHPPVALDDVDLLNYLGRGAQGAVYAGRVQSTGLVVAVKVFGPGDAQEKAAAHEAQIGSRFSHPNLLRVFAAQKVGDQWVVVMEYLQGPDLGSAQLRPSSLKPVLGRLADAVVTLSEHRIVHRDIKPANIIIRRTDQSPVLVDYGIAFVLPEETSPRDPLREMSPFCGTPMFMPPEAFPGVFSDRRDPKVSPAWDAYSLGVTALRLQATDEYIPRAGNLAGWLCMKGSGEFDLYLLKLLPSCVRDSELAEWCRDLLGGPDGRWPAIQQARAWAV
jgi:serine/threonine protein kinase